MSGPLRLALAGDSIIQRPLNSLTDETVRPLFDLIRSTDVAFTNLEVIANDFQGHPALESGGMHLGAPATVLDDLRDAGFNLFATATNHSLDYGVAGVLASIEAMEARKLNYAGIGRNLEEARRAVYLTHPRGTVAMMSCTSTFAKGQEASHQKSDMIGRPGLSPLRFTQVYDVTPDQLAVVRQMADQLGIEKKRLTRIQGGYDFHPESQDHVAFGNMLFHAAARPGVHTSPEKKDVEGIARWVREARGSSDIVIVSIHSHEDAGDDEQPAEFVSSFARRMIDEGADLVVGHGPHHFRGIELYRGKPIFYSLGNIIRQSELVPRLPSDSFERFRVDPASTPGQVYRVRSESKGAPPDRRIWETMVPVCVYDGGRLSAVEIHPVSLGFGERRPHRGRPRLAKGDLAGEILHRFAELCRPLGTELMIADGTATLRLPSATD